MDIQQFLTYFINLVVLTSIIFFILDFLLLMLNSWQKLDPYPQPNHYQQVKDLLWNDDPLLAN